MFGSVSGLLSVFKKLFTLCLRSVVEHTGDRERGRGGGGEKRERGKGRAEEDELGNDSVLIRYLGWSFSQSVFIY